MTTSVLHATALGNVSRSLQALHKVLLRFQANQTGFEGSPLELFDLATKNSAFAWLKPLREAIVALDERRADPEPITDRENEALKDRLNDLLDAKSGPLANRLRTAFQSEPEAIWAISSARKSLSTVA